MDTAEKSNSSSFEDLSNLNENELKEAAASSESNNKTDVTTTTKEEEDGVIDVLGNGQIMLKVLKKGEDEENKPQRADIVKVNILGKLENGQIVEDLKNFTVQIGDVEVVQAVDMAIPLMHVGETAEIIVDSRFAYGALGLKNEQNPSASIPPAAKIIYVVDLLSYEMEDDIEVQPFQVRKKVGDRKRERGNFWYSRNEYNLAIQVYRRALEYLNDNGPGVEIDNSEISNEQLQELLEIRMKVYNNLAAAQMKISAYEAALTSVDNVLRCQPENVKAIFRKGKILEAKGDTNLAIPVLQKGAMLDPESKAIQQLLSKCVLKSKREARNEKDLYQKMLGHTLNLEEEKKQKSKQTGGKNAVPKLTMWGYFIGSILIGVAGVAMYRYRYF